MNKIGEDRLLGDLFGESIPGWEEFEQVTELIRRKRRNVLFRDACAFSVTACCVLGFVFAWNYSVETDQDVFPLVENCSFDSSLIVVSSTEVPMAEAKESMSVIANHSIDEVIIDDLELLELLGKQGGGFVGKEKYVVWFDGLNVAFANDS